MTVYCPSLSALRVTLTAVLALLQQTHRTSRVRCFTSQLVTVQTNYGDCCPYIVQYTPNTPHQYPARRATRRDETDPFFSFPRLSHLVSRVGARVLGALAVFGDETKGVTTGVTVGVPWCF